MAKKNAKLLERFRPCSPWKLQQAAKPCEQRRRKFRPSASPLESKMKFFLKISQNVFYTVKVLAQFWTSKGAGKL